MDAQPMIPMPLNFQAIRAAVQQVLRHWYDLDFDLTPWTALVCLGDSIVPDPRGLTVSVQQESIKRLTERAFERLAAKQPEQAALLHTRYRNGVSRGQLAVEMRHSLDQVRHQQAAALDSLASALLDIEEEARLARKERILARLDLPVGPRIFGQPGKLAETLVTLQQPGAPMIVAIDGIGGIGKTTLADAVVRALVAMPGFVDVFWIGARQTYFSFTQGIRKAERRKAILSYDELLLELARALGAADPQALGLEGCARLVREALHGRPYLVVVDNLETLEDQEALVPDLLRLAGPSKFLLTTRQSLRGVLEVYPVHLDELAEPDLLELVRYEAQRHGLHDLAQQPDETLHGIYQVVGGNPLAAKLVIGQAHGFTLDELLGELREARGANADDLYRHVYWRSWHALSPEARQLLQSMPLAAASGDFTYLLAVSRLDEAAARAALRELLRASLVETGGAPERGRYRIHRLTETFLLHEVLQWPLPDNSPE
jgi:hypothetical protein